ncbi:hypothetical protein CVT24_013200, partial [Panaeolus cyanescens]
GGAAGGSGGGAAGGSTAGRTKKRLKHQLFKDDIPDHFKGMKRALIFHIKVLWGLIGKADGAVPVLPSDDNIAQFARCFQSKDQLTAQGRQDANVPLDENLVTIPTWNPSKRRTSAENRQCDIPEVAMSFIKVTLAKYGLCQFAPDFRVPAYNLYNHACRMAAIDSFRQMIQADVYSEFAPERTALNRVDFMIAIYDHTVHLVKKRDWKKESRDPGAHTASESRNAAVKSRKRKRDWKKESRDPGAHTASESRNAAVKSRKRLCGQRLNFLHENRYPGRYMDMVTPHATSDDERDPNELRTEDGVPIYWIRKVPGRSKEAERFIRILDEKRNAVLEQEGKRISRMRLVPETGQKKSLFKLLPKQMPMDYYDPDFFNGLTPKQRSEVVRRDYMVLLPNVEQSFTRSREERLPTQHLNNLQAIIRKKERYNFSGVRAVLEEQVDDEEMNIYSEESDDEDNEALRDNANTHVGAMLAAFAS